MDPCCCFEACYAFFLFLKVHPCTDPAQFSLWRAGDALTEQSSPLLQHCWKTCYAGKSWSKLDALRGEAMLLVAAGAPEWLLRPRDGRQWGSVRLIPKTGCSALYFKNKSLCSVWTVFPCGFLIWVKDGQSNVGSGWNKVVAAAIPQRCAGWRLGSPAVKSMAEQPHCSFLFSVRKRRNELLMSEKDIMQGQEL